MPLKAQGYLRASFRFQQSLSYHLSTHLLQSWPQQADRSEVQSIQSVKGLRLRLKGPVDLIKPINNT